MAEPIGQQLRKARLERGLALEQAAQILHIRLKYLQALEDDRQQDLPSPVQAKGFLRMYAGYLNLPDQALLEQWEGKTSAGEPDQKPTPAGTAVPSNLPAAPSQPPSKLAPGNPEAAAQKELIPENNSGGLSNPSISQQGFEAIGHKLRNQRQILGLTLAELERYTHVRQHYLQALENGSLEELPSPVQGRGMLSNYARFLNLDVEALLMQFAESLQARRVERLEKAQPVGTQRKQNQRPAQSTPAQATAQLSPTTPRRLWRPDFLVSGLIIFIVLGFALWTAAQVDALQNRQNVVVPPSIADVLLSNPTPSLAPSPSATLPANLSTRAPGEVQGGLPGQVSSPAANLTLPAGGNAALQLYISARQRAYLRITVDGKILFDGRIIPGTPYSFAGDKKIELLTGSAAAIQVFFNQKDLGSLGLVGQVKSLVFTKDGALTPTPLFTPTSTRTQQPSSTLRPSPTLPTLTITPYVP